MKTVKDLIISEGVTYSGVTEELGGIDVPNGMGIMKYQDHKELGLFKNGKLAGISYINYHDWMNVGYVYNDNLTGWGLKIDRGVISFGVFDNNILRVNLTPLVEIFWKKILSDTNEMDISAIKVSASKEIFIGVPQYLMAPKFGFHFLENGEVFLGACDEDESGRTGKFLHFDSKYNITKGEYKDGELIREITDLEFVEACGVFVDHAYMDFDITKNYDTKSFLFNQNKLMFIFEIGKTAKNLLVKANVCTIKGNNVECSSGNSEDTIWFAFPINYEIEEELKSIMNNEDHPWIPNFEDYSVIFVDNLPNTDNRHQPIYQHVSCWNEDAYFEIDNWDNVDLEDFGMGNDMNEDYNEDDDFQSMLNLIPDALDKKYLLENQWQQGEWYYSYPSIRDYVLSLGTDDDVDNFFGWLFNDSRLDGCFMWSLPRDYEIAFKQFLKLFQTIE